MTSARNMDDFKAFKTGSDVRRVDVDPRAAKFERLYRESYSVVFGRVLFQVGDREMALDVTAEAFLRAARHFDRFDPKKSKFSTWVNTIAHNCAIDHFRKSKSHAPLESVSEALLATEPDHANRTADADLAERLLALLSEEDRLIVCMRYYEGRTIDEIARELGMNPSTVSTRTQRALVKMRAFAEKSA